MGVTDGNAGRGSEHGTGGKAYGLLLLKRYGFRVPPFHVFTSENIRQVREGTVTWDGLVREWAGKFRIRTSKRWAVRSSAGMEDGQDRSRAGIFLTRINVPFTGLGQAIEEVVHSYGRAGEERSAQDGHGVIVQEMVEPLFAGVLFTRDPVDFLNNGAVINFTPGLGEKLVSGAVTGGQVRVRGRSFRFEFQEDKYIGFRLSGGVPEEVELNSIEMEAGIRPHLKKMLNRTAFLERKLGFPLDLEFAISGGTLYWLQVRKITGLPEKEHLQVWDNTQAEGNFPGLTLPLTISLYRESMATVYTEGARRIGFRKKVMVQNRALVSQMAGGIHGALYYNVTAWQSSLYQMPFGRRLTAWLTENWSMEAVPYHPPPLRHRWPGRIWIALRLFSLILMGGAEERKYQALFMEWIEKGRRVKEGKEYEKLVEEFEDMKVVLGRTWMAPMLNGLFAMVNYLLLKRMVFITRLSGRYPDFVNDLIRTDGRVVSVAIVNSFRELVRTIYNEPGLLRQFRDKDAPSLSALLEKRYPEFHQQVMTHIYRYGDRSREGELKMETITYKMDPDLFLSYLKNSVEGDKQAPPRHAEPDYRRVIRNPVLRWVVRRARERIRRKEDHRFQRTKLFGLFREHLLAMGQALYRDTQIDAPRDILYLHLEEILDVDRRNRFRELISERKKEYSAFTEFNRSTRYIWTGKEFLPVAGNPDKTVADEIMGIGCCSGVVEGEVLVMKNHEKTGEEAAGRILVAPFFEPGAISLFSQAKGIISERGNLLSHTSILCREMNIPSIVGARGIVDAVKEGSHIKMDGRSGIVRLLKEKNV